MYTRELPSSTWILDSVRAVADALWGEGRLDLASKLSEAIGGMTHQIETTPATRTLADGLADDFEIADDAPWDAWDDDSSRWTADDFDHQADDPTPVSILAADWDLPPIRGGAPEAYRPSESDWDDYFAHRDREDADERDHNERGGRFTERDARAAGLPV